MNLNDVNEGVEKNKKRKRLGRGTGSGLGKTSIECGKHKDATCRVECDGTWRYGA